MTEQDVRPVEQSREGIEVRPGQHRVRTGGHGDHVPARIVDQDQPHAGVGVGLEDARAHQSLPLEELARRIAEHVRTELRHQRDVGAEALRPDGLVRPFSAGSHVEGVTEDGLPREGQRRPDHGEAHVVTAHDDHPAHDGQRLRVWRACA